MAERIKEVAVEEADRLKVQVSDAARSGAYFYPLRVSTANGCFERCQKFNRRVDRVLHISSRIALYGSLLRPNLRLQPVWVSVLRRLCLSLRICRKWQS